MRKKLVYKGWIKPRQESYKVEDEKTFLETLNIKVGGYNTDEQRFDGCEVSSEHHAQVTLHVGRFEFSLEPQEVE